MTIWHTCAKQWDNARDKPLKSGYSPSVSGIDEPTSSGRGVLRPSSLIEVCVAADLDQLPGLRAIAETVGLLCDLSFDEIADVRLALDEVATSLITNTPRPNRLRCEFLTDDRGLITRVSSMLPPTEGFPDRNGFSWYVVRSLTDSVMAGRQPDTTTSSGYRMTVEFRRRRADNR